MATTPRPARAPRPAPAPKQEVEKIAARTTNNAWWCPWDDRAMALDSPCDVCGAVLRGHIATRHI